MSYLNYVENVDILFQLVPRANEVIVASVLHVSCLVASGLSRSSLLVDWDTLIGARYRHEKARVSPGVQKLLHMVDSQSSSFSVVSPVVPIS